MKILVINTCPFFNDGITNVIMNLQGSINQEEFQMDLVVVAEPSSAFIEKMQKRNCRVYYHERSMKQVLNYVHWLAQLIKKNRYDVVHIHGNSHTTVLELFSAFMAGCKTRIVHAHNTFCKEKAIHLLMTPVFNILCTERLACGNAAGVFMHGKHKFHVINNGINTERFRFNAQNRREIREHLGLRDRYIIGHIGTLYNEQKNQEFIFKILSEVKTIRDNAHFCLVGDGEDRKRFEMMVSEIGISDIVSFVGAVDDVAPYLSAFDVIAMPSKYEGLPLSLIEEQANGLTCIVSNVITQEVDKTGNVKFLSLSNAESSWIDKLGEIEMLEDRCEKSNAAIKNISDNGYSIEEETRKLERIYLNSKK